MSNLCPTLPQEGGNFIIMRYFGAALFVLILQPALLGQVTEDFDHNNQSVSESNCWEYSNVSISRPNSSIALNNGNDRPLADADLDGTVTASLISPYTKFDGPSTIDFQHKLKNGNGAYSRLAVYLEDPTGVRTQVFFHIYRAFYTDINGDPTNDQAETISFNSTDYAQVVFEWQSLSTSDNGYVDEIVIDGDNAADASNESNGYCPAIFELNDTVCSGSQNVTYEALYDQAIRNYSWSFSSASAGSIDLSISGNDASIQLDFDTISGDFELVGVESTSGHQTVFYIHVEELPALTHSIDSICLNEPYTIDLQLTGNGPWELDYQYDGSGVITTTISNSSHTLSLPADASNFEFLQLTDQNGCSIDDRFLPSVTVHYYPKPGPITLQKIE